MKRKLIPMVLLAGLTLIYACKGKKATTDETTQTTAPVESTSAAATTEQQPPAATNETKTYTVTATPDSVILGKNKEAVIKIKNLKAVQLSDPNGKSTGTELTYDLEVTNKNKVGGNSVYVKPDMFRLLLDNGTKITHDNSSSVSVDAESTKSSTDNKFIIPAGTKPASLNVFYDETSASVKLELK